MTTPIEKRRTTLDPHHEKRMRIIGALHMPQFAAMGNRALARALQVDESTVRRVRSEYGLAPKVEPTVPKAPKNAAGKKVKKKS